MNNFSPSSKYVHHTYVRWWWTWELPCGRWELNTDRPSVRATSALNFGDSSSAPQTLPPPLSITPFLPLVFTLAFSLPTALFPSSTPSTSGGKFPDCLCQCRVKCRGYDKVPHPYQVDIMVGRNDRNHRIHEHKQVELRALANNQNQKDMTL